MSRFQPIPKPSFPECGGVIGESDRYFSIGKIGSGTFCSISKCVDLGYHHRLQRTDENGNACHRVVACKFELSNFANCGVLEGEANILRHLSKYMPKSMIPKYFGTLQVNLDDSNSVKCIMMEYLAGEDMDRLRYRHAQMVSKLKETLVAPSTASNSVTVSNGSTTTSNYSTVQKYRRLNVKDAVYLCKDVFLPLLQHMHDVGVIHRDVKPSNCVRVGTGTDDRSFKLVDFGLSKSFIVPIDSPYADNSAAWTGPWNVPLDYTSSGSSIEGCIRKEREDAEFRGTSMYASLRVHQKKDYCRRDDIWGMMYVFCDLVSGGLPWMSYAANRNRQMCQIIKEYVHGERDSTDERSAFKDTVSGQDHIDELLKGAEYHLSKFKYDSVMKDMVDGKMPLDEAKLPKISEPLSMSKDSVKLDALRVIFQHLTSLQFSDRPNYELISNCLEKFLDISNTKDDEIPPVKWEQPTPEELGDAEWKKIGTKRPEKKSKRGIRPSLIFQDDGDIDPLKEAVLEQAENLKEIEVAQAEKVEGGFGVTGGSSAALGASSNLSSNDSELSRLPLQLQFRLAQVEYNARNPDSIPLHLAFRDWMELATSLVYDTWESETYEKGGHRTSDDGYRRELFLRVLHQTLEAAKPFDNFVSSNCFYFEGENGDDDVRKRKRRNIGIATVGDDNTSKNESLQSTKLAFSKVSCALRALFEIEKERLFAPPPALSFGPVF